MPCERDAFVGTSQRRPNAQGCDKILLVHSAIFGKVPRYPFWAVLKSEVHIPSLLLDEDLSMTGRT